MRIATITLFLALLSGSIINRAAAQTLTQVYSPVENCVPYFSTTTGSQMLVNVATGYENVNPNFGWNGFICSFTSIAGSISPWNISRIDARVRSNLAGFATYARLCFSDRHGVGAGYACGSQMWTSGTSVQTLALPRPSGTWYSDDIAFVIGDLPYKFGGGGGVLKALMIYKN